ncbi:hypothetical protein E5358_08295 [Palleniella muris]|uniref:Uncharacterized protein n=1 Tax=Palleniella muris TaxID=3038145 RepID=A0AC61QQ49_9BACT|nr:restriction endonuclease subunit S [Palleniella muris]TGX82051.1 hypothetical protein E5358_08295 [Palleniella muris]
MILEKIKIKDIIGCRFDFTYLHYIGHCYRYPTVPLRKLLTEKPQYGSGEAGIIRENNETIRYVRITDIDDNGLLLDNWGATVNNVEHKYILNDDDILIARSGNTVGKSYIHKTAKVTYPCLFAGYMIRFVVNQDLVLPDYLFAFTQTSIYKEWVKATQRTTGQPNINAEEYGNMLVPLPPFHIQKKIIDAHKQALQAKQQKEQESKNIQSRVDTYILNQLGVILPSKDSFENKCNIISVSQLINKRFDPYYHQEYFDQAFKQLSETSNYKLRRLSDITVLITSGITPKSGGDDYTDSEHGVAFIRSGNIDIMGEVDFDNLLYIKREVHDTRMKSSKVQNGDIMIAIVGATIGQVGIYHSSREANINQAIALVRLKDGYNPEYIKEVIKSSIGQLNLDRLKRPVARANINLEEISSMLIPVPEIEIQNKIVKNIVSIRQQAKRLQKEGVELLEKTKQEIENIILGNL